MLILKEKMRSEFKKPFGKLYPSLDDLLGRLNHHIQKKDLIISVGDVTTKNLLDMGIIPDIGIVDNKIARKPSKHKIDYDTIVLRAENPPGTITKKLWEAIEKGFELVAGTKDHVLIIVDGEEDLSVVPCVLTSPQNTIILYGQPEEGVVLVEADKVRNMMKDLIKKFEEVK